MKLLAIGGSQHGKELPVRGQTPREGLSTLVPIQPRMNTATYDSWTYFPNAPLIRTERYETRLVSDRLVWVYVA